MPKQNLKNDNKKIEKEKQENTNTTEIKKDEPHFAIPNKPIKKSKKKKGKKIVAPKSKETTSSSTPSTTTSVPSTASKSIPTESEIIEEQSEEISFEESSEASSVSTSTTDLSSSVGSEDATGSKTEKKELALDGKTLEKLHKELDLKKKKVRDLKADERGVIRISRLPWGFEEKQLKKYFNQFGIVTNINLSRSRKTGNPRGYAYVEFLDKTVAQIVADTMNGYIMFSNILKCHVVPPEKLKKRRLFTYNPRTIINHSAINAHVFNQRTDKDKHLQNAVEEKNKKLQELGIDFQYPVNQILPEQTKQANK